jgi:hypothetical protein
MKTKIICYFLFFSSLSLHAQTVTGTVLDALSNQPLESVAIYFDNTTIGTTTNDKGEFSISYNDAVQSILVISYLGYEKVFINDYRNSTHLTILLKEAINALDAVVIDADDGMSRRAKLRWFRKEFLGVSNNAKSSSILNEKDLRFRYDKSTKTLTAWSNTPVIVYNKNLQYEVSFDLEDFEIEFQKIETGATRFYTQSVNYYGTSFYKALEGSNSSVTSDNRQTAFEGSVQHFLRALYNNTLEEEGYVIGKGGLRVNPYDFFVISETENDGFKAISFKGKLGVAYYGGKNSVIETTVSQFYVDKYGNYFPIGSLLFGGDMGAQRIGDMLPLDYRLDKN